MREIILDLETTGPDYKQHKIIEIGAIEFVDKYPTGKKFHKYVNPDAPVSEGAYRVHGLSNEFLKDKPRFSEVADELLRFINDDIVVAHYAKFDVGFLNNELALMGAKLLDVNKVVCTFRLASKCFPNSRLSLNALCKRFKVDITHRVLHGALCDAELLMKVYSHMTGYAQASLEGSVKQSDVFEAKVSSKGSALSTNIGKIITPNAEESKQHLEMLNDIEDNLWQQN
jgi:DNA polymerase-3 subunit epsilon